MNNQVSTKEFLVLLFGKYTDGCITITTLPDARTEHIPVQQLDKVAEHIAVHGRTSNTYYGTALRCEGLSGHNERLHSPLCKIVGKRQTAIQQNTFQGFPLVQ